MLGFSGQHASTPLYDFRPNICMISPSCKHSKVLFLPAYFFSKDTRKKLGFAAHFSHDSSRLRSSEHRRPNPARPARSVARRKGGKGDSGNCQRREGRPQGACRAWKVLNAGDVLLVTVLDRLAAHARRPLQAGPGRAARTLRVPSASIRPLDCHWASIQVL